MKIIGLFIYPIKSCQGISLDSAYVSPKGLVHPQYGLWCDRTLMIVDENGKFLTQRQYPQMATIKVEVGENCLFLSSENQDIETFQLIPKDEGETINVKIWKDNTIAINQGKQVNQWLKKALKLNINFYLVKQSNQYIRPVDSKFSLKKNQPVSFADGFPFLITNTASLKELNRRLEEKYPQDKINFPMDNFRPNIVIETDNPFIEDTWRQILISQIKFQLVKPCSRCIITTTNQKTGAKNPQKEPLLILSEFRHQPDGVMFGENAIALDQGIIKIGDSILVNEQIN